MDRRIFLSFLPTLLATARFSLFSKDENTDVAAYFVVSCAEKIDSTYPEHNATLELIDQKFILEKNLEVSRFPDTFAKDHWTYFYKFRNERVLENWASLIQQSQKAAPLQKLNRTVKIFNGQKAIIFSAIT